MTAIESFRISLRVISHNAASHYISLGNGEKRFRDTEKLHSGDSGLRERRNTTARQARFVAGNDCAGRGDGGCARAVPARMRWLVAGGLLEGGGHDLVAGIFGVDVLENAAHPGV